MIKGRLVMLLFCLIFEFLFCLSSLGQSSDSIPAEPCRQVDIPKARTEIMRRFIQDCVKHGEFINNKGIVRLTEFTNSKGLLCWQLSSEIDDQYKRNPPTKFVDFEGDIVLFYDGIDSLASVGKNPNADAYNKCLEEIIGDRVYIRPTIKTRWTNKLMSANGKPIKRGMDRHVFDGGVEWIIVFNKDGTYKISY